MPAQPPTLPPHEHDPELSVRLLESVGEAISEHQCDLRPDCLFIPEHDLYLRCRAGEIGDQVHSYFWAEQERWEKPAVVFMMGWGDSLDDAARKLAASWASGIQPAFCSLFDNPRNPKCKMVTHAEGRPDEVLPWRGATGPVHGWHTGSDAIKTMSDGLFLNAIMSDVTSHLHRRELMSILAVLAVSKGKPEASVYINGWQSPEASAVLAAAQLPDDVVAATLVCQKLFLLLEPCEWSDVDRTTYPSTAVRKAQVSPVQTPEPPRPWWRRLFA